MRVWFAAVSLIALVSLSATAHASFITNGSFETVPNGTRDQGLLPSGWFQASGISPGADTYSNDGSYGLNPGDFGNFPGVTAFDGIRWVAGASVAGFGDESFGTKLTMTLTPGQEYMLQAHLYQAIRSDLDNPGAYRLSLSDGSTTVSLGSLAPTTGINAWEARSLTFTAPTDASSRPFLIFTPYRTTAGIAYPGLDDVSLHSVVPEPASLTLVALGAVLSLAVSTHRGRRRKFPTTANEATGDQCLA